MTTAAANAMTCNHQSSILVTDFLSESIVCRKCGEELPRPGYACGIRDYYIPGDAPWRRYSLGIKRKWALEQLGGEQVWQCPVCLFVGLPDDFDVMGATGVNVFCPECSHEFEPDDCSWEPLESALGQQSLFT